MSPCSPFFGIVHTEVELLDYIVHKFYLFFLEWGGGKTEREGEKRESISIPSRLHARSKDYEIMT